MRRLYSSFARGAPGIGLLLLRLVCGADLLICAVTGLRHGVAWNQELLYAVSIPVGLLLAAGLWTPIVGSLIAIDVLAQCIIATCNSGAAVLVGTVGIALSLLGPGIWSVDARLFGWQRPQIPPSLNPRFVVTNLKGSPRRLYEKVYCARAEIENRIKELHHGLEIDRTSCTRFLANQFRVLITAAAYVLMQELRRRAAGTSLARAQVSTLRERLLKLGARIERSVRRLIVHLPHSCPFQCEWRRIALSLGAVPA